MLFLQTVSTSYGVGSTMLFRNEACTAAILLYPSHSNRAIRYYRTFVSVQRVTSQCRTPRFESQMLSQRSFYAAKRNPNPKPKKRQFPPNFAQQYRGRRVGLLRHHSVDGRNTPILYPDRGQVDRLVKSSGETSSNDLIGASCAIRPCSTGTRQFQGTFKFPY